MRDKTKKLASLLAMSYDMYNIKLDNADDTNKKLLPALQELRDELDLLKEVADIEHKQEKKLTSEDRTVALSRLKELTRKYLTQRSTIQQLIL